MLNLKSPAKINFFLKIIRRRPDGFRELASLFQAINLFDELSFEYSQVDSFSCSEPTLPIDASNLVIKARTLFREKTNFCKPISIHLSKNIPHEAGLGGGSSNAATTLWAMNEMANRPLNIEELKEMAADLGSDVPFFLSGGAAYCTGRGEQVEECPAVQAMAEITLFKPNASMPTEAVYKNLDLSLLIDRDPLLDLKKFKNGEFIFYNDLQYSAFALSPYLKLFYENLLQSGFTHVMLSGSGSAFFAIGKSRKSDQLPVCNWSQVVTPVYRKSGEWYCEY